MIAITNKEEELKLYSESIINNIHKCAKMCKIMVFADIDKAEMEETEKETLVQNINTALSVFDEEIKLLKETEKKKCGYWEKYNSQKGWKCPHCGKYTEGRYEVTGSRLIDMNGEDVGYEVKMPQYCKACGSFNGYTSLLPDMDKIQIMGEEEMNKVHDAIMGMPKETDCGGEK